MEVHEETKRENIVLRNLIDSHNEAMVTIQKTLDSNGKKLDWINGTVRRHKLKHFPDIFSRIRSLEDIDKVEEGIEIGKTKMSASTKSTILIVSIMLTCFIGGTTIFWSIQNKMGKNMMTEMNTSIEDQCLKAIMSKLENLQKDNSQIKNKNMK